MKSFSDYLGDTRLYCSSLTQYKRRKTREVYIGDIPLGGNNPIRVQSMTTVDTMDTMGSVEQCIRMIEAGCEYIRITAPSIKEAENLREIRKELHKRGYKTPLIADIHFTPNAAELAAKIVEKVRVNPGNYADKKRFEVIEYDDDTYQDELDRIRERFSPLVEICKEHGTAMRIGTNHGSLSDRIMSRYGDTPMGMVESALEFVRICEDLNYYDLVISMKSSNPQVMVQAYRLLVAMLDKEGLQPYPLHLGVTEAGEAEDGRIKSAMGIGTLLEDGLGDTVRVSLTEEPEYEAPVARALVDRYLDRPGHEPVPSANKTFDPYKYTRRQTSESGNIGDSNVPRVIADYSHIRDLSVKDLKEIGHYYLPATDKWTMNDLGADYIFTGDFPASFMLPNGLKEIISGSLWRMDKNKHQYPLWTPDYYLKADSRHVEVNFLIVDTKELRQLDAQYRNDPTLTLVLTTENAHAMADLRAGFLWLQEQQWDIPVIIKVDYQRLFSSEEMLLRSSTDAGGLFIDGFGDGIWLTHDANSSHDKVKYCNDSSFGILQASRTRISKTEYISCPSCGRTLFDLQETTAMIRKRTDHLKGVKIGIMGCIVNGPGEMADADYGYVGSGKGKITLYRGQNVVKRNVPSENAVDELINLIKEDDQWNEPVKNHELT